MKLSYLTCDACEKKFKISANTPEMLLFASRDLVFLIWIALDCVENNFTGFIENMGKAVWIMQLLCLQAEMWAFLVY